MCYLSVKVGYFFTLLSGLTSLQPQLNGLCTEDSEGTLSLCLSTLTSSFASKPMVPRRSNHLSIVELPGQGSNHVGFGSTLEYRHPT